MAGATVPQLHICPSGLDPLSLLFSGIVLLSKFFHLFLKYLGQPRFISENIAGMLVGHFNIVDRFVDTHIAMFIRYFSELGILAYMFVLGLEMEPRNLLRRRTDRESILTYAGIASTFVVVLCVSGFALDGIYSEDAGIGAPIELALTLSNTASTILTRLITDLKIGKSNIGRLVVSTGVHTDMVSMLLMAVYRVLETAYLPADDSGGTVFNLASFLGCLVVLCLQTGVIVMVVTPIVGWINSLYPEGKPMSHYYLAVAMLIVILLCALSEFIGFSGPTNAFLLGLAMPREGRVTRMLVQRINVYLGLLLFPYFYFWVGRTIFGRKEPADTSPLDPPKQFIAKFTVLFLLGTVGKAWGTVIAALKLGYQWPEALAVGCLLNVRGHYHILCAINNLEKGILSLSSFAEYLFSILATVVYIPLVVMVIIRRARKRQAAQQLALQYHDPTAELRIVMCLQGPHNVPAAIKIIEATRGGPQSSGLIVYAMDMVELTGLAEATLTYGDGMDAVTVTDEAILHMRDQIGIALNAYLENCGDGVTIRRLLAISRLKTMYHDLCNGAKDVLALLLILPFHKRQKVDGSMDVGEVNLRSLNKKVLSQAPCSVGILVDRGLGREDQLESSMDFFHVAVIFIGGADDREALVYAGRLADHPAIKLTAIRFLHDEGAENSVAGSSVRLLPDYKRQDLEMRLDDECFAEFYERCVANGTVGYVEKYAANGAETAATLRALEANYALFIVGHAGRGESPLTAGMGDWQECPELGPIGDTLAASDFSQTASVLIIQQHNPLRQEEEAEEEDNDFSIR